MPKALLTVSHLFKKKKERKRAKNHFLYSIQKSQNKSHLILDLKYIRLGKKYKYATTLLMIE